MGDIIEQARPVEPLDLDDGGGGGRIIVEIDARAHLERACALLGRALGKDRARQQFAGQRFLDALAQAFDARPVAERPAIRILHGKYIERETIGGGEGLRIHDRAARHRDRARKLARTSPG